VTLSARRRLSDSNGPSSGEPDGGDHCPTRVHLESSSMTVTSTDWRSYISSARSWTLPGHLDWALSVHRDSFSPDHVDRHQPHTTLADAGRRHSIRTHSASL
jgi:hypothetical protein